MILIIEGRHLGVREDMVYYCELVDDWQRL